MNRLVLLVVASLAAASAVPLQPDSSTAVPVAIVRSAADGPNPDGTYNWSYETENGIKAEEHGELKAVARSADNEEGRQAIAAQGAYSYTAPDGTLFEVKYVADENGFQPQGAHLPVAPAIPEAIQRSLEWIATHPHKEQEDQQ
ncbi:endocuticle structural glycoprotein ABD-4-like [Phymastichus coffea]|uniref:endocuticle structural glycoprotein ABD-4-like n=1 Tax=Phymastichus coffea TaxID=108790 RepID=UPI00273AAA52|nr:endocuticle structural glycoprotein ABD-4-like [Phymastichus coffea]